MRNNIETLSLQDFKRRKSYEVYTNLIGTNPPIGKAILSPLREEKHPSFNVYKDEKTGEYRFKDHGTDVSGDCVQFFELIKNCDFKTAIELLQQEYNCTISDYSNTPTVLINSIKPADSSKLNSTLKSFEVKTRIKFTEQEAAYFKQYKIKGEIVKKFNVLALDNYTLPNGTTIKRKENELFFCINHNTWAKIYKPNSSDRKYRFLHLGNKPTDFIFGYDQLPPSGDQLIITGGEKDVLTLSSMGYNAISLNSETATLSPSKASEFKSRFKEVIVLYDIDETGLKASEKLCQKNVLKQAMLPLDKYDKTEKDISDFIMAGFSQEELNLVLENAISFPEFEMISSDKCVYDAVELLAVGKTEPEYLMKPIFPRIGTAVLIGKPDTGKSQFTRQLCINVASGVNKFIEVGLTPVHNRAIYITTEDSMEATSYLLNKQLFGLNLIPNKNLKFIFGDILEHSELLAKVEASLKDFLVDIIVVDCFGDIFPGSDNNNNMAMRNTVRTFSRLAGKYKCLVLFVHHINKGGYRSSPAQEHIQGGSGFAQKIRAAIQLSEGEGNLRYLTVVKGNYCPKEFKENSLQLEFSEENFLFTSNGHTISTSEIGTSPDSDTREDKYAELRNIAEEIYGDKIVTYGQFVEQYCAITDKSIPTAKRAHANLKKMELIIECSGGYRLASTIDESSEEPGEDEAPF